MAKPAKHDWFSPLLLLGCCATIAMGVLSGRWGLELSLPSRGSGSQWHLHIRYGTVRLVMASPQSDLAGLPSGAKFDTMTSWRYEWDVSVMTSGNIRAIQVPLWFFGLFFSAWFVVRIARRSMRRAAGVCPGCGKTVGGGINKCPKCDYVLRPAK
jgi:hypothetical protein